MALTLTVCLTASGDEKQKKEVCGFVGRLYNNKTTASASEQKGKIVEPSLDIETSSRIAADLSSLFENILASTW